ncbi:MAG TPA: cytochrome d ubiquinol oxidase subunit II [Polyangia bacterium]|nr:cytochrome d ubiquinol oxidase subunit II [Polyangia bacterium]
MVTFWFVLVAIMLVAYVVFDGFDLGVGAISKWVARTPEERAVVRSSIGPVWDANEVWLIAAGAVLYFAFPQLYASSFSGFYLPLMMVLWLLIGRAMGLELRHHLGDELFGAACDTIFMISSLLLPVFFGAALGNVIRGVPLDAEGTFFLPLWTNFRPGRDPGVLDWYTVLCGLVALAALSTHGAHFLALRTKGSLNVRARHVGRIGAYALPPLTAVSLAATIAVRPTVLLNFRHHPVGVAIPVVVATSLAVMVVAARRGKERIAFTASVAYLASMLVGAAFALYPVLLPSSGDPDLSLTVTAAATGSHAMRVAAIWWPVAFLLVAASFTHLYRTFRGKLSSTTPIDGYH